MAGKTDGYILANVQVKIAATGGEYECARNRRGPDDLVIYQPFDVLEHRISMVADLGERCVGVRTKKHGVWAVDTDETQLTQPLGNGFRILANVGGERHDRIAGSLANAADAGGGIAIEYGGILGK